MTSSGVPVGDTTLLQERDALVTALECAAQLERWVRNLDVLLAECDAAAHQNDDHPDGDEWVGSYYLKCGHWHRVLQARQQVAWALQRWCEAASAASSASAALAPFVGEATQ